MRHIVKRAEPASFATWRNGTADWRPTSWNDLQNPEKRALWEALLQEQGHACCYCGARVRRDLPSTETEASHIEHMLPRDHYADLMFDYQNLAASCQGRRKEGPPREPRHCGSSKENWPTPDQRHLFVSPTNPACASYFRYRPDGRIEPGADAVKADAAAETIRRLRLDHSRLVAARAFAIDTALRDIDESPTDDERRGRIAYYLDQHPGEANRFLIEPFLGAIEDCVRRYG